MILSPYRRAAVLGAGLMGSQIAAHLASVGLEVDLLDLPGEPPPGAAPNKEAARAIARAGRSAPAAAGLQAALARRPPAFFSPDDARRVRVGNFDDDLGRLAKADWVVEAVVERLEPKRQLLARVDSVIRPGTAVTTNTSGISIAAIAQGRSDVLRANFFGTHFFNPPRYMYLLEVIPAPETDSEVTGRFEHFAAHRLGKGVVRAKDTPLFIANRIGVFVRMCTIWTMIQDGYTIDEVDAICGPALGRPRTAVFRLGDLVGLDTSAHVTRYLYDAAAHDERRDLFGLPPFIVELIQRGHVGDKAGRGYYRKVKGQRGSEVLTLDWRTMEYRPREALHAESLQRAAAIPDPGQRIAALVSADDPAGRFAWKTLSQS
ncbi:MAG: 3-hydroxyacyl-CoA dehydrogenase family protein, partial [Pirellulales bacterium]